MKRFLFIIFIMSTICGFPYSTARNDLFKGWTEERIKAYRDSLYIAMRPEVKVAYTDSADMVKNEITGNESTRMADYVPVSVNIDKTCAVGKIDISSGVTQTGAKVYEVPIKVPAGMNNFQPELSLAYNSQQGNSLLGIGWSLNGLSKITRVPKTLHYNNVVAPLSLDKNDCFVLDGYRLILIQESGSENLYQTEQGNIKVTGHLSGDQVDYFTVYYPDGRKAEMGKKGVQKESSSYLLYSIRVMSDIHGNKILYEYDESGEECITSITYNGCSIEFGYIDREDVITTYGGGEFLILDKLLSNIKCKNGDTVTGEYSLSYAYWDHTSELEQIDYTVNGKQLNPLQFYYGENFNVGFEKSTTQLIQWHSAEKQSSVKALTGRFDYDSGEDGLISVPNHNPYWESYYNGWRYENMYDGTETILLYADLADDFPDPYPNLRTGNGFIDILCADLHGNQQESIVKINNIISRGFDKIYFNVYGGDPILGIRSLFERTYTFPTAVNDGMHVSVHPKFYYTGDFDGDGKIEIMAISIHNPFEKTDRPSMIYIFDLLNDEIKYQGHLFPYEIELPGMANTNPDIIKANSDRLFVMDFDGDGKTDIGHLHANGITLYSFDVSDGKFEPKIISTNIGLNKANLRFRNLYAADLNCDGMTDIIITPETPVQNDNVWSVYYSMGNGSYRRQNETLRNFFYSDDSAGAMFRDVNGDGKADLIAYTSDSFSVYYSDNSINRDDAFRTVMDGDSPSLIPLDLNSHNYSTHLSSLRKGVLTKYSSKRDDAKNLLLTGMTNSLGIVEKTEYKHLSEDKTCGDDYEEYNKGLYTMGYGAIYPYVNICEAVPVVSITETYQDGKKIVDDRYKYENAVVNRWGLGFCGFEKITCEDMQGLKNVRIFEPYGYGALKEESSPAREISYSNSYTGGGTEILNLKTESKVERDLLRNVEFTTSYSYDKYGNVLNETTDYGDGLSVEKAYVYASQENIESGYYIGYNISQNITTARDGETFTEETEIVDFENLQPVYMIHSINGNIDETKEYVYDTFGNILIESVQKHSSNNPLLTSYEYDSKGYMTNKVNHLGNEECFVYDSYGRIINYTDIRGNETVYVNDALGRVIEIRYPDGRYEKIGYSWCADTSPGVYEVKRTGNFKPTEIKYYDAKERVVRESDMRFNGILRNVDTQYDEKGNAIAVSLPYTGSTSVLWNRYEYDEFNRPTYITQASGKATVYSYSGLSTRILEDNVSKTKTYDVLGNLLSVSDPGGTVTFTLNPDGQPSSITSPDNIKTTIRYDSFGRRISMNDPSLGTTVWEYDDFGNLASKTNAANKEVAYEYDEWGRLISETASDTTIKYTFDDYGDVTNISTDNESSLETEYDNFGRIVKTTEMGTENSSLIKEYTYSNSNSLLMSVKFTYGGANKGYTPVTEYYTYSNGHRSEVKINGNSSIFRLVRENSLGQPVKIQTGSITREYEYDDYGHPVRRKAYMGDKVYQDISYTHDLSTNNLLSREDHGIKEEFGYDELNRLKTYYDGGVIYDNKGNILAKKDVGGYFYNNKLKPYAITTVEQTGVDVIPSGTQKIAYTSFGRPLKISEDIISPLHVNQFEATFEYNYKHERCFMYIAQNTIEEHLRRYYLGDCVEVDKESVYAEKTISKLYLMGDYYSSPAVYLVENKTSKIVYILRDMLGSITHVVDSNGDLLQEVGYDAWGRLCNPKTKEIYSISNAPKLLLGRGYTGHEHIPFLGLINMNARLYDPVLGRMLSPDPYVQDTESTQNFNRYSYALNNPMKFSDPDGEFLWLIVSAITDLFKNIFRHGFDFDSYDFTKTKNAWKLDMGMFKGSFKQILNKFTWNAVNSGIGNTIAQGYNLFGRRGEVTNLEGMVCLSNAFSEGQALTFGHYSVGPMNYKADWRDHLFVHEYGHYIQAQRMGPAYTGIVAIPSLISAAIGSSGDFKHLNRWFEQNASKLGAEYFDEKYGSGAEGYENGSENHFDINKFISGGYSPYQNPRDGMKYQDPYNVSGSKNSWWQFAFVLIII